MLEEVGLLLRGVILGLAIAAPVGPIGLLCIRRTIERGIIVGLATGLGAAVADAAFSAVAAFGVGAILDMVRLHETALRMVGGLFLLGVAVHSFLRDPQPPARAPEARNLAGAVASGFVLTVTNPITLMGIAALVVGFGGDVETDHAVTLVAGIFIGSCAWWAILCGGVSLLRSRMTLAAVHWINVGTGALLGALGLWAVGGVVVAWAMGPAG